MLYAVLRCILACMVPADIKNDHCWDLGRGGRGGGASCKRFRVSSPMRTVIICSAVLRHRSTPGPLTSDVFSTNISTNGMKAGARHRRSGGVCVRSLATSFCGLPCRYHGAGSASATCRWCDGTLRASLPYLPCEYGTLAALSSRRVQSQMGNVRQSRTRDSG